MATGWWAEVFVTITTRFQKMQTTVVARQTQSGTIATAFKKMINSMSVALSSEATIATSFKKMQTSVTAWEFTAVSSTIATSFQKMQTSVTAGAVPLTPPGAKTAIFLPNPGQVAYPILPVLRQAMQGGKTPQRRDATDDPTKGARTSIILPNAGSLVYPVLGVLRQPHQGAKVYSRASVTYDATGNASATVTASWTHAINGNAIVVFATTWNTATLTATVGGISAPSLGFAGPFNTYGLLYAFAMMNPPTGAQTVAFAGGAGNFACGCSISYQNVSGFGTPQFTVVTGTPATASISATAGQMLAQAFADNNAVYGSYNQTQRVNFPEVNSVNIGLVVGDAPSAPTVNFSAANSDTTGQSGSVVIPINPQ
jgi:hypothetical protein